VHFAADAAEPGQIVDAKITAAQDYGLRAELARARRSK
jgi:hypothetical protein